MIRHILLSFITISALLSAEIEYDLIAIPSPVSNNLPQPISLDARGRIWANAGNENFKFSPPHYEAQKLEFVYQDAFIEYNFDHIHNPDNYPTQEPTQKIIYINKRGVAVGIKKPEGDNVAIFFLDRGKETTIKTNLQHVQLTHMNNRGQAVGYEGTADKSSSFIFDKKGKSTKIGSENHPVIFAHAINDHGQVVGNLGYGEGFIWDNVQGLRKLSELIPDEKPWVLHYVMAINNRGEILCAAYPQENPEIYYLLLLKPKTGPHVNAIKNF